ncbi:hypothetical protein GCM10010195_28270 [Kitasatospora griseola]|nr:hypothetical protein GCM10010195_28270 [Kitasatospora griseola]
MSRCEVPGAASVAAPSVSDVSTIALVPSATVVLPPLVSSRVGAGTVDEPLPEWSAVLQGQLCPLAAPWYDR